MAQDSGVFGIVHDLTKNTNLPPVSDLFLHCLTLISNIQYFESFIFKDKLLKVILCVLYIQDVVNNHVTQLRSMVGKKSGTVQELNPKKLAVSIPKYLLIIQMMIAMSHLLG